MAVLAALSCVARVPEAVGDAVLDPEPALLRDAAGPEVDEGAAVATGTLTLTNAERVAVVTSVCAMMV